MTNPKTKLRDAIRKTQVALQGMLDAVESNNAAELDKHQMAFLDLFGDVERAADFAYEEIKQETQTNA